MQVEVEEIGPCRKRLKVTVSPEQVKSHIDRVFKATNDRVRMKGFRPGKIPRQLLEQQYGDEIRAHAKESLVEETFREALQSNTIEFIGSPKLDISEAALDEQSELSYSVDLDLKPAVEIGDVKSIELERRSHEPTDEEIEGALHDLANSKRKLQPVEEPIEEGDFAKVDLSYQLGGETIVEKTGLQINPRIAVVGTDREEFRARLVGLSAGEETSLPITYPDTFEKEEARGQEGDLGIKVNEVIRFVSPPLDDELAKTFEFDTMDELKEELVKRIRSEKENNENTRLEESILDTLFSENPFELPDGLVDEETKHRLEHIREEMKRSGAGEEDISKQLEQLHDRVEQEARVGIRNHFLIEALSRKHKLFVTETDVQNELKLIAQANDTDLAAVRKHFEENNLYAGLRLDLLNRKVRDFLRATAKITDSED